MSQMLKSSGAMGAATLASRILGLVREMAYAWLMGRSWVASSFLLAFQVPNLFRRLLGEGALTAAFVPLFKQKEKAGNAADMWRSANAVLSGLIVSAGVLTILAIAGISVALAVGHWQPKTRLMLELLRIMFPYVLLVCVAAVLIAMANARGQFFVPALGAAVLNVVMIGSVFLLAPRMGELPQEQVFALGIGVLLAGIAQVAFQLPGLHAEGFRFRWVTPWGDPTVREVVRKMIPGSIGVAAFQINVLVINGFAFWLGDSIVASYNYAVRLMELPQGIFGISLATYLLPALSGLVAEKNYDGFRATLRDGIGYLVYLNLIAATVALVLAEPIVRLLFQRGDFGASDTPAVAAVLACLAPGLVFFSLVNILGRAFYALGDIQTPMRISVFCLVLNVVFSLWLVQTWREAGLGIANSLTSMLNTGLLLFALRKKLARLELRPLRRSLVATLAAAVLSGQIAWLTASLWDHLIGHRTLPMRLGHVFVPLGLAGVVYFGLTLWLKVPAARDVFSLVGQKLGRRP